MMSIQSVPGMTKEQINLAYSVIPEDYWSLQCWTCREPGHNTFTCPLLSEPQRLYFAYKYYLYQVEQNPHMKSWYEQKMRKYYQGSPDPGPRPRNKEYNRGGMPHFNRGGGRGGGRGAGFGRGGGEGCSSYARGNPPPIRPVMPQLEPTHKAPAAPVQILTRSDGESEKKPEETPTTQTSPTSSSSSGNE